MFVVRVVIFSSACAARMTVNAKVWDVDPVVLVAVIV